MWYFNPFLFANTGPTQHKNLADAMQKLFS